MILTSSVVGKARDISREYSLLNPFVTPLTSLVGFSKPVHNIKHEWLEDSLFARSTTLTTNVAVADTTINVTDASFFRENDVIAIAENDELLLITAIAGTTITVTRGFAGTTPATATTNDIVKLQYNLVDEGADAKANLYKAQDLFFNYTQIFTDTITISGSMENVKMENINDMYTVEFRKKLIGLGQELEEALIGGVRYNSGTKRTLGGIRRTITSNVVDAGSAPVSMDIINEALAQISSTGALSAPMGEFLIMVGGKQKASINELYSDKVVLSRADAGRGNIVSYLDTNSGSFRLFENANLRNSEIIIFDTGRLKIKPLGNRSFSHTYLGKVGDSTTGQIIGEYTCEFKQEQAAAKIVNLT